jgi:Restriction endonuclease
VHLPPVPPVRQVKISNRSPGLGSTRSTIWFGLMMWMGGNAKPHPSIRWALDLLPHSPQQAIDAITGHLNVYREVRPEGRSLGLLDAVAIIRTRWIDDPTTGTEALFRLSPRELEVLVAALYQKLGYTVELTPPSRDGGRNVIATRKAPGQCGPCRSPPGAHHVGVHEVGPGQPGAKPVGELRRGRPLQAVGSQDLADPVGAAGRP